MTILNKFDVVLIVAEEGGYTVGCPSLPGCWSQGETEAEALEMIADAIRLYLDLPSDAPLTLVRTYGDPLG